MQHYDVLCDGFITIRDVNDTLGGIRVQFDIDDERHCRHLLDYATLVAVDVKARRRATTAPSRL
jgi:hypothetical protein